MKVSNIMNLFLSLVMFLLSAIIMCIATFDFINTFEKTDQEFFNIIIAIGFQIATFKILVNESEK